jgi:hypothetical protein
MTIEHLGFRIQCDGEGCGEKEKLYSYDEDWAMRDLRKKGWLISPYYPGETKCYCPKCSEKRK